MVNSSIQLKLNRTASNIDDTIVTHNDLVGEVIKAKDWSNSSLGPMQGWPQSLRTALNICLGSKVPMGILWGEEALLFYNESWGRLFDDHSFLGRPAREAFASWQKISPHVEQVMQAATPVVVNNLCLPFSHSEDCYYDLSLSPLPGERDAGQGVFVVGNKQVTSNNNLENRYQTLFKSMDEGYCIIEMLYDKDRQPVDYRYLETNPSFEEHTGLQNVEGKRMRELVPNHEDEWYEIYGQVDQTGEPKRFEQAAAELGRIFELYAFPFGDPASHQVAVLFQDITRRKRIERTDALLGAIVEGSDDAIVSKNLDGIITSWNSGAQKMFGYTASEIVGKSVTKLMPQDRVKEEDHILSQLKQGNRVEHFETVRQKKNGERFYVSLTISPIRDGSGNIVGASKIARDITQRKETESRLKELNETLEKRVKKRTRSLLSYQSQLRSLASKLSKAEEQERHRLATELHDNLGQMLAVSKMKTDLLRKDELSESLRDSVTELQQLLDDALLYTRELMSDLKPPPSLNKEDIRVSIKWVANKMRKHGLRVSVVDDHQPKRVSNEIRSTLLQCVRELLFNVIKHAGVEKAEVSMIREKHRVKIVVRDHGAGFEPEDTRSRSTRDGGFGLFNIKERMDLLGGTIEVASAPGEGTEVVLFAPLKSREQPGNMGEDEAYERMPAGEGKQKVQVLLVDDHKMMREGLRKIVEEQEDLIVVGEASDGKEAIRVAREKSPDVVVMDIDMPGMNGIDATQHLMSNGGELREDLRVIGLSLHGHESVVESMRRAGASAYLTKNEAFETLCATIRSEAATTKN